MGFLKGKSVGRAILLHGGASTATPKPEKIVPATEALIGFSQCCLAEWAANEVLDVVVMALQAMEADPQFNAGLGGTLQNDGVVRVTAAVMDGTLQSFSGIISAENVKHPSIIARWLQGQSSRVLTQPGVQEVAVKLGLPIENLVTESALAEWQQKNAAATGDTVGCVVRDSDGGLAAGTSTGGRPAAAAGRVSDSATVAGNYASSVAAISTTGMGEEIVDDALAARIETRCRDGLSLADASRRCYDEAVALRRNYGWIALHRDGSWVVAHTTPSMTYVVRDESGVLAASADFVSE